MVGLWLAGALPYHGPQEALSVVSMVFDSADAGLWGGAMKFWRFPERGVRWLLLASLCVNVVLATYVAVQWFQPGWSPAGAAMPLRMIERVAARLPADDADILWRIYRGKEPEILPLQMEYTRALLKTMRLTGQAELDKDALRAAVKEARDKRIKIGDAVIETFVEMLEQISPKGRRQLVGRFLRGDP
jgi:uncharacterized membrane protein